MEGKHTPGPWSWWPKTAGGVVTKDGLGEHVCKPTDSWPQDVVEANARLIAAAPDLLAACEATLSAMDMQLKRESGEFHIPAHTALHIWESAMTKAREAIKKARGE